MSYGTTISNSEAFTDFKVMSIRLCSVAAWFTKLKGHFNLLSASKILKMYIEIGIQKKLAKSSKITNLFFFKLLLHCVIDTYIFANSLVRSKWNTGTKIYFSDSGTYQGALHLLWTQWMFIEEINEWVIEWFPQAQVMFFLLVICPFHCTLSIYCLSCVCYILYILPCRTKTLWNNGAQRHPVLILGNWEYVNLGW